MKAVLAEYLWVPREATRPDDFEPFTYRLYDSYTQERYIVTTVQESLDEYGFPRGNLGKLQKVFGRFDFEDVRTAAPHDYRLRFTGQLYDEQKALVRAWLEKGYGLIQAPPRSGKCVVGSSLVVTAHGLIPVRDVVAGGMIETGTGPARVAAHYEREAEKTLKLRTHCGYEVHGTPEHPVLAVDKNLTMSWLPLDQVKPGEHKVAVACGTDVWPTAAPNLPAVDPSKYHHSANIYPTTPATLTPELARLLGYLVGEGSLAHHPGRITNSDEDLLRDFRYCLAECFGADATETVDKRNGVRNVGVHSVYLRDYLSAIGLQLTVSKGQEVPWCILQAPKHLVAQFLRAYFDADGTADKDNIEAVSASEQLIRQVQLLLLNFGIVSRRTVKHVASPHSGIVRPYYRLMLHGADIRRFHERAGFGLARKRQHAGRKRKHDRAAVLPFVGAALCALAKQGRSGWYRMADGTKRQLRLTKAVARGRDDETSAYEFAEDPSLLHRIGLLDRELVYRIGGLLERGHFWDDVESVRDGGPQTVYDVTVPGQHSFVADGLVVHNTVMMTAIVCKLKQRTLMLAHLEDLCHQLEETIRRFTNVNQLEEEAGCKLVGVLEEWDDFFPIATLSTYQCLAVSPRGRQVLRSKRDYFGLVMVDEVHRVKTELYREVVETTSAAYRCGVTATPTRKDGMHVVVADTLGPVVAVGKGEQLTVRYTWEETGCHVKPFSNWSVMWNRLVKLKRRDKQIAAKVVEDVRAGHFVLVTTERLKHLDDLQYAIQSIDPDITVGQLSSRTKNREEFRAAAKRGDYQVVIAMNKIVELGYNIPRWSCFHNTLPMANQQNWYQRISRIRTPMEPAFEGDDWQKPTPVARIWVDTGHPAVHAYRAIVEKENERLGFECMNPPVVKRKGKRKGLVGYEPKEET